MTSKTSKFAGLLAIVIFPFIACGFGVVRGSGDLVTESRSVNNFDRVDLSGSGEVVITQSGEESLTVETDDNIMQYVTTEVRDGTLYLGLDSQGIQSISPSQLKFTLTVKDLTGMKVSGSGGISAASLGTDRLDVKVSGSGDARVDSLTAEKVEVRISGDGGVELAGEVTGQDIDISGSGQYRAGNLQSETVKIKISGSGDATVWAIESLDAHVSGSGSVNYYGSPQTSFSGSGSGEINGLGEK
jgi:hypothetical protein